MRTSEIIQKAEELKLENNLATRQNNVNRLLSNFNNSLFPKENLKQYLSLDNYVRKGTKDTFTYWVEVGTKEVADIRGAPGGSAMFHIWSNEQKYNKGIFFIKENRFNKEIRRTEALKIFTNVKKRIIDLINFASIDRLDLIDEMDMFWKIYRMKIAYLYYPEKFTSIMKEDDIKQACNIFGVNHKDKYPVYSNSILIKEIRKIAYFKNWTSYMIGSLFYGKLKAIKAPGKFILDSAIVEKKNVVSEDEADIEEQEELVDIIKETETKEQIIEELTNLKSNDPKEITVHGKTYKRNNKVIAQLKILRNFKCQICNGNILKSNGTFYVEAAHIKSKSQKGPETPDNILILCPNHHKEFDYGKKNILAHSIEFIEFELNDKLHKIDLNLRV
ncbi:MAG: HNH endonuclease [Chlorobi bacterium]|nr:HNH endonuclease [Chlorobiota bacterium]MCI0717006.1 HNH endonuclease [Chlorobiota bacterium]